MLEKVALGMPVIQKAMNHFYNPWLLFKHYVKNADLKQETNSLGLLKLPIELLENILLFLNPAIKIDATRTTLTQPLCFEPLGSSTLRDEIKQAYYELLMNE